MSIALTCSCGKDYRVKDTFAGKKIRCKDCNEVLDVPAEEAAAEAEGDDFDQLMKFGRQQEQSQASLPPRLKPRRKPARRDDYDDEPAPRKHLEEGWFGNTNGGILGGVLMIIVAIVWFVGGLFAGYIFYYPPILLIVGMVAIGKGIFSND